MKNLILSVIACIFVAGCNINICIGPDYFTKHGICVYQNGFDVSKEEVEEVTDISLSIVEEKHPNFYIDDHDISMSFEEPFSEEGMTHCTAYYPDNYVAIFIEYKKERNCERFYEVMAHEILHTIRISTLGCQETLDNPHPRDWFVDVDESAPGDSIEKTSREIVVNRFCE